MKKFLSVILVFCFVQSMIPASFAAETKDSYVYNFRASSHNVANETSISTVNSFDSVVASETSAWHYVDARSIAHGKTLANGFYAAFASDNVALGKNGILFKIKVEEDGVYQPVLKYQKYKTGGKLLAFIVPTENSGFALPSSGGMKNLAETGTPLGAAVDAYDASVTDMNFTAANVVEHVYDDTIVLLEGEYYLMFAFDGVSHSGAGYMLVESFALNKVAPSSVSVTSDKNEISVNETASLTAVVRAANGSVLENVDVEYTSSSDSVAKVDENGVVTGVNPGVATITAMVKGTDIKTTTDIRVVLIYDYNFRAASHNVANETSIISVNSFASVVASESAPWHYVNARSIAHGKTLANGFYAAFASDNVALGKNGILFKIKVGENGVYRPVLKYQKYKTGGKLLAFIVPTENSDFALPADAGMKILAESGTPLGQSVDAYDVSVTDMNFTAANVVEHTYDNTIELSQGEYYLMFAFDGVSHSGAGYMLVESMSLVKEADYTPAPKPENAPASVSYGVFANISDYSGIAVDNGEKNIVGSIGTGSEITLSAEDVDGFTFRYWVMGSGATGKYYSGNKTVTLALYGNTAITAVYTADDEDARQVDRFNWNGVYVDSLTADAESGKLSSLTPATLTGYTFSKWILADETELTTEMEIPVGVTQAVAMYNPVANTLNGVTIEKPGSPVTNPKYEEEITVTGGTKGWMRDGRLVSYSGEYTYFAWDSTEITENTESVSDRIPLVVLDTNNGAFMLEYDEGDYEILEAGILFGGNANISLSSAEEKAKVRNILPHGQFTVTSDKSYARGYAIYRDGTDNSIKVIYSR
ncbi:MAG: Ig-like domain-containing protein [Oscillospiraceae bacterium]|nr:Ig-like domain-containing protein [Oscillospiraceae bacterium]MBQ7119709.1 Ig-like domain-containing protein [Oscillospiraceae bacterium]